MAGRGERPSFPPFALVKIDKDGNVIVGELPRIRNVRLSREAYTLLALMSGEIHQKGWSVVKAQRWDQPTLGAVLHEALLQMARVNGLIPWSILKQFEFNNLGADMPEVQAERIMKQVLKDIEDEKGDEDE